MTMPTVAVNTTNLDAGTDSRAAARVDLLDAVTKLNQIIDHIEPFAATLLDDTDAAAARVTLGVIPFMKNCHQGFVMSTTGSSATMTIGAGQCADSGNAALIDLAASINKTTSAWAVGSGSGGIDTGSIANNTWYHFYAIRRTDTGVVDVLFSLSATSPTMPTNYTQSRWIGAGLTNSSAQWVRFFQSGDDVLWETPFLDHSAVAFPDASRSSYALTVPSGVRVNALVRHNMRSNTNGFVTYALLTDLDSVDTAVSESNLSCAAFVDASMESPGVDIRYIRTNTSRQIGGRSNDNSYQLNYLHTIGFNIASTKGR